MHQYFKLVCLHDNSDWLFDEYKNGRVRFGWSGPGSDLRVIGVIADKNYSEMTDDQRITWRYSQFLLNRIKTGNRLILQFKQPLREFLIAEVNGQYTYSTKEEPDFNHILPCKPLTPYFINIESKIIPKFLRHDLSKRGHYYEIYPLESVNELDKIINEKLWEGDEYKKTCNEESELLRTKDEIIKSAIDSISKNWKAKDFEYFISNLIKDLEGVEVKLLGDSKKGWDLLLQLFDPITNEVLSDDVPVQCKNYQGEVLTNQPIEDLERCVKNSNSNIFYLFIIGKLKDVFWKNLNEKQNDLTKILNRNIIFRVIDQYRIAELYLQKNV